MSAIRPDLRALLWPVILFGVFVAACASGSGQGPPIPAPLHVVVRNATERDVTVEYQGSSTNSASQMGGTVGACMVTVMDGQVTDTWELRLDGGHVVGTTDRPELSRTRGAREVTVDVEVMIDGTILLRAARPGPAQAVDGVRWGCAGGASPSPS